MSEYFLLNTNSTHLPDGNDGTAIYDRNIAATFGGYDDYGILLQEFEEGDTVISYVSGQGYRAVGTVVDEWDGEAVEDSDQWIEPGDNGEYHIDVQWQQVLDEDEAIDWKQGNRALGYPEDTPVNFTLKHVEDPDAGRRLAELIRRERSPDPDLFLTPAGSQTNNLERTIENPVPKTQIEQHDPSVDLSQFDGDSVPVWGHTEDKGVENGDVFLFYLNGEYPYSAVVADQESNPSLADDIWEPFGDDDWSYIYYMTDVRELEAPVEEVAAVLDNDLDYPYPMGFMNPNVEKLARLRRKFGGVQEFVDYLSTGFAGQSPSADWAGVPDQYPRVAEQLESTGQVIFHGPPGTGKTYHAKRFAEWWVHEDAGTVQENQQIRFITFHPSFSYEDFIEGLTAKSKDGNITYELEEGVFKDYVETVQYWPGHEHVDRDSYDGDPRYVLIIDEINRGNVSNILGETVTLLESDKRADGDNPTSVRLAHSNEEFEIPSNVYLIGTMNTADRSISLVDAAIRRRFGFVHFPPDYDVLRDSFDLEGQDLEQIAQGDDLDGLQALSILALMEINETIRGRRDLGKGKQLGHSYLMGADDEQSLVRAWKYELLPLLEEYFFDSFTDIANSVLDAQHTHYLLDLDYEEIRTVFGEGTDIDEPTALRTVLREVAGIEP